MNTASPHEPTLRTPHAADNEPAPGTDLLLLDRLRRRDGLCGLLHEYELAA
jgi:hypothetical protein